MSAIGIKGCPIRPDFSVAHWRDYPSVSQWLQINLVWLEEFYVAPTEDINRSWRSLLVVFWYLGVLPVIIHLYTQTCFIVGLGPNVDINIRSFFSSGLSGASSKVSFVVVLCLSLRVFFKQTCGGNTGKYKERDEWGKNLKCSYWSLGESIKTGLLYQTM